MSEWVYRAKAAKFWGMNPIEIAEHPRSAELIGQAWDLMQIEAKAEQIATKVAKQQARVKNG